MLFFGVTLIKQLKRGSIMKHCLICGDKLTLQFLEGEGLIPYCNTCGDFRFPVFNTAVSTVIVNREFDKILLVKKAEDYILLAGFVKKGEDAEAALIREAKEEADINIIKYKFMRTRYYEKSNVLMLNYISVADKTDFNIKDELKEVNWFDFEEAKKQIKPDSLAQKFLLAAIDELKKGKF
jgi:NAD+ diphosphatase